MAFMAKVRAQAHYSSGSRILINLQQSSYVDKGLRKRIGEVSSSIPKDIEEAIKRLFRRSQSASLT
jgi:hypothetical protein